MNSSAALAFEITESTQRQSEQDRQKILDNPGFGLHFTDHMVVIDWSLTKGWHGARVQPYGPLLVDPASSVLHYAQEIFEGLKAYRHQDGSIWLFRPQDNARRLQRSAARLALPELPETDFLQSIQELIKVDHMWVPGS